MAQDSLIYLTVGLLIGALVAWVLARTGGRTRIEVLENELDKLDLSYKNTAESLEKERQRVLELTAELASAEANYQNLEDKLYQQKDDFKKMANEVLEERSVSQQNQLDQILKPFNEKLQELGRKVEDTYREELRDKANLLAEVQKLHDLNTKISDEANNLSKALKGDTKLQGNWGELVLEKVLERSGLVRGLEYKTQVTDLNVTGDIIKPDVVVYLPDNKHLIVDSKVSLVAYSQYVSTDDDSTRERLKLAHVGSVKNHVRLLADKNYQTAEGLISPDLVLLFMPIESAFSLALQTDPDLFGFAWDKRIVIVSPTTLLATLRTVASVWKFEKQSKNVIEIARLSGEMYDKFEGFVQDLLRIGKQLKDAQDGYSNAMNKLVEGRGNLVKTAEKLKALGARATKDLPQKLIDRAEDGE
jgi:DNA recombination protein RmuC